MGAMLDGAEPDPEMGRARSLVWIAGIGEFGDCVSCGGNRHAELRRKHHMVGCRGC